MSDPCAPAPRPHHHHRLQQRDRRLAGRLPARRIAEPTDIAEIALWLARETTRFLVGAVIVADGGLPTLDGRGPSLRDASHQLWPDPSADLSRKG